MKCFDSDNPEDMEELQWLSELRECNPKFYNRKLKILGLQDSEVPHYARPVEQNNRTVKQGNIRKEDYYLMGGKPYCGDKPDGLLSISRIKKSIDNSKKRNINKNPHNIYVYIDGENISSNKAESIVTKLEQNGFQVKKEYVLVYILEQEKTNGWNKNEHNFILRKPLGGSKKDKIDNYIKKEIRDKMNSNNTIKTFCIVTSDKGYIDIVDELKISKMKVIGIGEEKTPEQLRNSYDVFIKV